MSKIKLATKLADDLGVTTSKASRLIDDIGASRAQSLADDLGSFGGSTIKKWAAGGTLAGGTVGGGALVWREQDVRKAKALAEQQQSYADTVAKIADSDLPPELKKQLVDDATGQAKNGGGGSDDGSDDGGDSPIPDNPQTLIILMIVMIFALKFGLEGDD